MNKNRKGITLFITLAIVTALLALLAVVFKSLSTAREKALDKAALIQADLIYADSASALKSFLGTKPSLTTLKNLYNIPLRVEAQKEDFNLLLGCAPLVSAIPIQWLVYPSSGKNQDYIDLANKVFETINNIYQIKEPGRLQEMLEKAINSKEKVYFNQKGRLKRSKYFSYRSFREVLIDYMLKSDDDSVLNIPWKNYFVFGKEFKTIDANFLTPEVVSALFDIELQIVKENFTPGKLESFLNEYGGDLELYKLKLFAKNGLVAMRCQISYNFAEKNYWISFDYIDGKVDNFEFTY